MITVNKIANFDLLEGISALVPSQAINIAVFTQLYPASDSAAGKRCSQLFTAALSNRLYLS